MNFKKNHQYITDFLFVTSILFLFAFSSVMMIALGADIYENVCNSMSKNYSSRTACAYVTQKIRQGDEAGSVSIGQIGDIPAIEINSVVEGTSYTTYMYEYEGYLMELLEKTGGDISPEFGQKIVEANDASFEQLSSTLIKVMITEKDGTISPVYISTKCS